MNGDSLGSQLDQKSMRTSRFLSRLAVVVAGLPLWAVNVGSFRVLREPLLFEVLLAAVSVVPVVVMGMLCGFTRRNLVRATGALSAATMLIAMILLRSASSNSTSEHLPLMGAYLAAFLVPYVLAQKARSQRR